MRNAFRAAVVAAATFALTGAAVPASAVAAAERPTALGNYIVVLDGDAPAARIANEHAQSYAARVTHVYQQALRGYAARMSPAEAARVARDPRVQWVQPDRVMRTTAQTTPTGIDRVEADRSPTAQIDGTDGRVDVDVAVIDTGADLDHPDLNINTAGAKDCTLLGLSANDGNGHGTHVSGTIGALDNDSGVVGVAPGARIWPVKVLTAIGVGLNSDVICGVDYVTAHADEIEVANMSLGGAGEDDGNCGRTNEDALHTAICASVAAGVTYAVAAGNDHADARDSTPAAYDEVITVSALADFDGQPGGGAASTCREDTDDTFADFSNFGADVDLIAPGVCILSTSLSGGTATLSGTSMATPHVAGGAALYVATHPGASPASVKSALQAAGSTNWIWPSEDGDGTQERLLDVSTF